MSDLIDRQLAIDALRYAQHRFTVADEAGGMGTVKWSEYVIYFAEAERILTELSSAQPEKSTEKRTETHACDLISRQAAIDAIAVFFHNVSKVYGTGLMPDAACRHVAESVLGVEELPSAQPERKKGKWLFLDPPWFRCSECGAGRENKVFMENFCPNCGADMRGEK